jgi:hypothetical protein
LEQFPTIITLFAQTKPPTMKNILVATMFVAITTSFTVNSQQINFPERYATWKSAEKGQFKFDESALDKAVDFANANEYSGS